MNAPAGLSEWNRAHLVPGLCSVTLRSCSMQEVVAVAADAGLAGIEWDTDVHVVDDAAAEQAALASADAGLGVLSLGSYYRLGSGGDFSAVTRLAVRAGAPRIRVWAGPGAGPDADESQWSEVVDDAQRIADLAGEEGMSVAIEYDGDALASTMGLLTAVNRDNVGTYWQPGSGHSDGEALASLRQALPFLAGVHCFSRGPGGEQLPLAAREGLWESVAAVLHEESVQMDLMLASVQDGLPADVLRDADVLLQLVLRED